MNNKAVHSVTIAEVAVEMKKKAQNCSRIWFRYGSLIDPKWVQSFRQPFHSIFAYHSPMGTERASTTRQRETGVICCRCHAILPPVYRERYCKACEPRHRVYMHFQNAGLPELLNHVAC